MLDRVPVAGPAPAKATRLRLIDAPPRRTPVFDALRRYWLPLVVGVALLLGALVRASFVSASDFPLNDGGLFLTMSQELQDAGYALPHETSYNEAGAPFAYPPLGLYAAAALDDITPLTLLDVLRFLPLTVSTLTILAFYLLARSLLDSKPAVAAATMAFALVPRSFIWIIMGGGLTRSFGMLFAILALHQAHAMYARRSRAAIVGTTIFAALTVLSHLEMAWYLAFTSVLFWAAWGRNRDGVRSSLLVAIGTLALTAPWWGTVIARHGLDPFRAAVASGGASPIMPLLLIVQFRPTGEPMFALIASLGVLGALVCCAQRRWLLPAWLVACGLIEPRAWGTVASVPIALLAGVAFADFLLPRLLLSGADGGSQERRPPTWLAPAALFLAVAYAVLVAMVSAPRVLSGLPKDQRDAMAWMAGNTPAGTSTLVVTDDAWASDGLGEWFPVLTQRRSAGTVQGYEWVSGGRDLRGRDFHDRLDDYKALQACSEHDAACLAEWSAETGERFDYVYLPKRAPRAATDLVHDERECCAALRAALRGDAAYAVIYDGSGATIFERTGVDRAR